MCSGMFTADAVLDPQAFRTKTANCVSASAAAVGVSSACLACYVNVETCCMADTLGCGSACAGGGIISPECDLAMKQVNCVAPFFTCAGLPSPL
jgi:hypothetical protein